MSKTYFIKLKPTKPFFFGGESSFGFGEAANYLVKSRYFPQQTSLLGMLRFQILKNSDAFQNGKITDKEKAKNLIGKSSFNSSHDLEFGAIKRLSPILVYDDTTPLFACPLTADKFLKEKDAKSNLASDSDKAFLLMDCIKKDKTGKPKPYNAKNDLPHCLIKNDTKVGFDTVFKAHEQVGITKDPSSPDNERGFYKKTAYQFNNKGRNKKGEVYENKFHFGFYVEIDDTKFSEFAALDNELINLGGERSLFKMAVEDKSNDGFPNYTENQSFASTIDKDNLTKVVLISDVYVDSDIYENSLFAVTETIDFRNIESMVEHTEQYYNLPKEIEKEKEKRKGNYYTKTRRSVKKTLLKRGSVFFCQKGDVEKLTEMFDKPNFQKIGYNQYTVI